MRKLKNRLLPQLFIIYTRYLIGAAFVFAAVIKIKGGRFTSVSGELEPINSAWHFFETMYASGLYWKFIGVGQIAAGLLLMTQRYAKLGALMFLPVVSSVFVITISYDFRGTPYITGLMLLANIMLIAWDWDTLKILINKNPLIDNTPRFENDIVWQITGLAIFLFTFIYRFAEAFYNIFLWGGICVLIGITGLIISLKRKAHY